jgi:RND family efflux transporter MFP subunit
MNPSRDGRSWSSFAWRAAGMFSIALAVTRCGRPAPPPTPPPPAVTVSRPLEREVIEWDEYTGRLEAVSSVEVRARVTGLIESAPFKEGTSVKKGDVLFVIDVRPFRADLNAKIADVASARAQVLKTGSDLKRIQEAVKTSAVSERDRDAAQAAFDRANAELAAARAAQEAAQLRVDWCYVLAPIDGRISNKRITEGNLVNGGTGDSTLLTTVVSQDPIYCYATVDEASVLKYAELARQGRRVSARYAQIPTFMGVASERGFPHEGVVDFVDNRIEPGTGTVRGRGVYRNPDGFLQPGMFARIRIPGSGRYRALLIPDAAVAADQNRRYALAVNDQDVVELRPIKLGALFGELRAIESGVKPGDRIIVNGLQRARPGSKVKPTEQPMSGESLTLTAPGSPTTQALPATRHFATTSPATTATTATTKRTAGGAR